MSDGRIPRPHPRRAPEGHITILPTPIDRDDENLRGVMIRHAKMIADNKGEMDGFLVIGLWADGTRSLGYRVSQRIPRELLPAYVAEMVRTDCVTEWQAERTFDDRFEWRD